MTPAEALHALAAAERFLGRTAVARRIDEHACRTTAHPNSSAVAVDAGRRALELVGAQVPRLARPNGLPDGTVVVALDPLPADVEATFAAVARVLVGRRLS